MSPAMKMVYLQHTEEHIKEGAYERTGKTGMGYRYQRDGDG